MPTSRCGTPSATRAPLMTITRAQAEKLAARLGEGIMVDWAMRYGKPSIAGRLAALKARGLRPHPHRAALSAVCGCDHGDGQRRSLSRAGRHALAAGHPHAAALSRRPSLHRGACATRLRRRIAALPFRAGGRARLVPRPAARIPRQGRPLSLPVPQDVATAARAARLAGGEAARRLPVALRARRMASALH